MTLEIIIPLPFPIESNLKYWLEQVSEVIDQIQRFDQTYRYTLYIYQSQEVAYPQEIIPLNYFQNLIKSTYSQLIQSLSSNSPQVPNWDVNIGFDFLNKKWLVERVKNNSTPFEFWIPRDVELNQYYKYLNLDEGILQDQLNFYAQKHISSLQSCHFNTTPTSTSTFRVKKEGTYGALGGTFDHLHPGHKILLSISVAVVEKELFCGVMAPETLKSKSFGEYLESIEFRVGRVEEFIKFFNPELNVKVAPIYDGYGPTVTDPHFDSIILTEETAKGGDLVNERRHEKGWNALKAVVVQLIPDGASSETDTSDAIQSKLSSTSIRKKLSELAASKQN